MAKTNWRVNQINLLGGDPNSVHYTFDVVEDGVKITDHSDTVAIADLLSEEDLDLIAGISDKLMYSLSGGAPSLNKDQRKAEKQRLIQEMADAEA